MRNHKTPQGGGGQRTWVSFSQNVFLRGLLRSMTCNIGVLFITLTFGTVYHFKSTNNFFTPLTLLRSSCCPVKTYLEALKWLKQPSFINSCVIRVKHVILWFILPGFQIFLKNRVSFSREGGSAKFWRNWQCPFLRKLFFLTASLIMRVQIYFIKVNYTTTDISL